MRLHKRFWMRFRGRKLPGKRTAALEEFERSRAPEFLRKEEESKITNKAGLELRKSVLETKKAVEIGGSREMVMAKIIVMTAKKQGIDKKTAIEYARKFGSEEIAKSVETDWAWIKKQHYSDMGKEDEYSHLK